MLKDLEPQEMQALCLLAAGQTRSEVSRKLGIAVSCLDSWKARPDFKEAQREATMAIYEQSIAAIVSVSLESVQELEKIINDVDVPARTKISAIALVLTHAEKCKSYVLEQRLERIEQALNYVDIDINIESDSELRSAGTEEI
ncbi:hypothetical protein NIES25_70280 (plasmid) [Nostoc linckia NIES-25]|nr:hypothetical protein NIES25_70280 [Nostoc linckia NIES-25]